MTRQTFILFWFFIILLLPTNIYAQEDGDLAIEDIERKIAEIKNPFEPRLPVEEKPIANLPYPTDSRREPQGRSSGINFDRRTQEEPAVRPQISLNITGVIWNSDRPQAIINGRVVDIGDKINEAEIVSIEKEQIVVSINGETQVFRP